MNSVNIGHGNLVAASRIIAVVSPDSAPMKRLIQDAREDGRALDVTGGRKTRCVLIADTGHIILCALQTETAAARLNGSAPDSGEYEDDDKEDREDSEGGSNVPITERV